MSKNVTLIEYPEATILKSYETFVAIKPLRTDFMVTEEYYSKTTSRHINDFFGGSEKTTQIKKVSQKEINTLAKFLEAYHNG